MEDKYAFLMIDYDTPELIHDIQNILPSEELYTEDNADYGIEYETHVTLVPCLDNDVDVEELKKLLQPIDKYVLMLTNVSLFTNNENFDVLKCDANSIVLSDTNRLIKSKFPTHSEYKDYNPHVTIAYLKKGLGDKYTKEMLSPLVVLKPKSFHLSFHDENGERKQYKFR